MARINADNADNFHAPYNDDWLHDEEDEDRIIGRKRVRFYVCRYGGASFVVVAVRFYVVYVQ